MPTRPPGETRPPDTSSTSSPQAFGALLEALAQRLRGSPVFASVTVSDQRLQCVPQDCPEDASYRVDVQDGSTWVSLVTPHRYLSQSIEQDLVHTGDKMQDLLNDELIDQGYTAGAPPVEHFRSPDKLFTFRTRLPFPLAAAHRPENAQIALQFLLAFEATFRPLGDMSAGGDE